MTTPLSTHLDELVSALSIGDNREVLDCSTQYLIDFMLEKCDDEYGSVPDDFWDAALRDLEVELTARLSTDDELIEPTGTQVSGIINKLVGMATAICDEALADLKNTGRP